MSVWSGKHEYTSMQATLTDDKGDHGCPISSGLLKPLDEFLHLPYLDVLLRLVGLWGAHVEQGYTVS